MMPLDQNKLRSLFAQVEQIQKEIEAMFASQQKQTKILPIDASTRAQAEFTIESLGYLIDDLDSVLGNLEELIEQ